MIRDIGILTEIKDILHRESVKAELKRIMGIIMNYSLSDIRPYLFFLMFYVVVTFLMILAILIILVVNVTRGQQLLK